jgi:hypothetical protein
MRGRYFLLLGQCACWNLYFPQAPWHLQYFSYFSVVVIFVCPRYGQYTNSIMTDIFIGGGCRDTTRIPHNFSRKLTALSYACILSTSRCILVHNVLLLIVTMTTVKPVSDNDHCEASL